jgi:hypothetical protein
MTKKLTKILGFIIVVIGVANFDPSGWRGIDQPMGSIFPIAMIGIGVFVAFWEEILWVFGRKK